MRSQQFAVLGIAAVVAMAAAVVVHARRQPWTESRVAASPLAASLARDAAAIGRVEIRQGETALTLERKGQAWSLKERDGYPVKSEAVNALIGRLAQSDLVEPKTRSAANYPVLELEDPAVKGARSRQVRLIDDRGVLLDVVIGKRKPDAFGPSKGGTYLRRTGEPQSWLATGDVDVATEPRGWLATSILDLPADKIAKVSITIPGEAPLVLERGAPGKFKVAGLDEAKKLRQGNPVDELARAAASFDLDDVRKLAMTPAGDKVSIVTVESDGGLKVTLRLRRDAGADWVSITAAGDGEAAAAVNKINGVATGWEFRIPAAKAGAVLKKLADLVEAG